jgi:hypothetical protein
MILIVLFRFDVSGDAKQLEVILNGNSFDSPRKQTDWSY